MTVVLGVDLATGDARVLAVDLATGTPLAEATAPLAVEGTEQPAVYAAVAADLIAQVVRELGTRSAEIAALAITGTSGTVVPVNAGGAAIGNALLYNDARGAEFARLLAHSGHAERPGAALARTAWLHAHRPAERYVFTPDVVAAFLARELLPSDTSHALKSGIDPVEARWDLDAVELLGIDPRTLPALVRPGRVVGEVHASVAAELGLPASVSIVSGMTDGATAQLATGAVGEGDTVGVLGTTLVLKGATSIQITDAASGIYSHVAPNGAFWAGGASNAGAGSLRSGVTAALDPRSTDPLALAHGPSGVVTYPLIRPGERFPVADSTFAGFAVGFRPGGERSTDPIDRFRGILEGVAFVERRGLERLAEWGVRGGRHHLAGGASSSAVWNGIRASVLQRSVVVPTNRSSAFGAAILAAIGVSDESMLELVGRLAGAATVVDPVDMIVEPLAERYAIFAAQLARTGQRGR